MAKQYTIFISHSWSHTSDLIRLRTLLGERGYFHVDFSEVPPFSPINSSNAPYIKHKLKERIANSDVVLGIAGVYASYSDWIQWELETAEDLGVPIIGVIPRGHERVSCIVRNKAMEIVRWNTESIVSAIRRNA